MGGRARREAGKKGSTEDRAVHVERKEGMRKEEREEGKWGRREDRKKESNDHGATPVA